MITVRVLFHAQAWATTESMRKAGGYASIGELLVDALRLKRSVDHQIDEGYGNLFFRDPDTQEEYELVGYPPKR